MIRFNVGRDEAVEMTVGKATEVTTATDLSNYYTKSETDEAIAKAVNEVELIAGPKGDPGMDGRTPVKGTDYFTEADKVEMVTAVVSALPVYGGETE